MRTSYSLGSLLSIDEILGCVNILQKNNPDTVWIPETWGMENFSMLSTISQKIDSKIGSSIINIYSRSPALISMGAVTVDTLSKGRLILGLGTSSLPIVENFHGYDFEKPLTRMREYVEIVRRITSGKKIDYDGKFFHLKSFSLLIKPIREKIPIYLAAVNQKMVELTWEIGDGVIFYLRPINELKETISKMQSKRKINSTCQIITAVSEDSEEALNRVKTTIGFYVSVGKVYRDFLADNGFSNETKNIYEEFLKSGLESVGRQVPDSMANSLAIYGTPEECKKKLQNFRDTGINLPIIQFNPIGDTLESFRLLTNTFSGDEK